MRKKKGPANENKEESASKRKHGYTSSSLNIEREQLLNEARTWQPDQHIKLVTTWASVWAQHGKPWPYNQGVPC